MFVITDKIISSGGGAIGSKKLSWLEFQQKFSTEEACRKHLFQIRWLDGFKCPAYGNSRCRRKPHRLNPYRL